MLKSEIMSSTYICISNSKKTHRNSKFTYTYYTKLFIENRYSVHSYRLFSGGHSVKDFLKFLMTLEYIAISIPLLSIIVVFELLFTCIIWLEELVFRLFSTRHSITGFVKFLVTLEFVVISLPLISIMAIVEILLLAITWLEEWISDTYDDLMSL